MKRVEILTRKIKYKLKPQDSNPLPADYYNEFNLVIPKTPTLWQKIFPDKMFWIFLLCIAVKLVIFLISLYFFINGKNRTRDPFFVKWTNWWNIEGLCDFDNDYMNRFWRSWLNGDSLYSETFEGRYLYPPLFYYLTNLFARWTMFSAPIVMLGCNIVTGYFVFRLAKNFGASPRAAKSMMVLTLLSPFNLFYSDFIWQNAGVFTTFLIISMYQISNEKNVKGMLWLGLAISVKQVAIFFLPFFVVGITYKLYFKPKEKWMSRLTIIQYLKSIPISAVIFYTVIPIFVFIFWSLPFIISNPNRYFYYLLGNNQVNPEWLASIFGNITPLTDSNGNLIGYFPNLEINPNNSPYQMNYRAALDVACAWIGHILGLPTSWTVVISILFHMNVFLICGELLLFLLYWRIVKNQKCRTDREYYWLMWYIACLGNFASIILLNRGVYKYYFLSITPMWAMYDTIFPLNYKNWQIGGSLRFKDMDNLNKIKYQFFGGGSIIHVLLQLILQIFLMFFNKWLAVIILYLPMLILGIINLLYYSKSSPGDFIIEGLDEFYVSSSKIQKRELNKIKIEYTHQKDSKKRKFSHLFWRLNSHI